MIRCKICGLNPNDNQSLEQQKDEEEHIIENGMCSACENE